MTLVPLLSVCIPTFNRRALLAESLQALLPQAMTLGIEVCVSDNASEDDTTALLRWLQAEYPRIRVVRQPHNVGLDANMLAVIEMATGRYIYPLGDDDVVPEGRLIKICGLLASAPDLVVLDGWHTDAALVPQRRHLDIELVGRCFESPTDAFAALWDKMPFGAFLGTRECFAADLAQRYIGTSHAYTGVVWDALAQLFKATGRITACCGTEPMVMIRGARKTWSTRAAVILLNEIPAWFDLVAEEPVYAAVVESTRDRYLAAQTRYRVLLDLRSRGQMEPDQLASLTPFCTTKQSRRILAVSRISPRWIRAGFDAFRALQNLSRR